MLQKIRLNLLTLVSRSRRLVFGKHAVSITYKTDNGLICLPFEDFSIGRKLGFNGNWDIDEIAYLSTVITKEDTVYLIGTHVGTLLIPLARVSRSVVGFEANPSTFDYLKTNIFLNGTTNSLVFNYAVGNEVGKIKFLQNTVNSAGSKIVPKINDFTFSYDNPSTIDVDMIPLDEFINTHKLPDPNVLIIDIEGAEYIALQGMKKSLKICRALYIEFEPNHLRFVSNCTTAEFFNLFIHDFAEVRFMHAKKVIRIDKDQDVFFRLINDMYNKNIADDLLFTKK